MPNKKRLILLIVFLVVFSFTAFAAESVTIINRTGYTIYYLKVSPGSSDDWGDDWLGDDVLMDGDYVTVDLTSRGFGKYCEFDIKAIDEDDDSYIKWEQNLCDRSKIIISMDDYVPADDEMASRGFETDCGYEQDVVISNDTGYNVWYVYISPSDSDSWGEDRLGDEVIMDGDTFDFCMPGFGNTCTFDVKIEDSDGDSYIKMGVDLCSTDYLSFTLSDLTNE